MIKNICFDLDDTIFDFAIAEKKALIKTLQTLNVRHDELVLCRYSVLNDQQWKRLERGELTRSEVKVRRFQLLFQEYEMDASAEQAAKIYEGFLGQGHYFVEGAEEFIKDLHKSGKYRMYLVSNGTASVQRGRLSSSGIEQYFDSIFISEEIGKNKPDPEFFDICFSHISDCKRDETIIIGDSLTSDILGGINAGIHTVWFNLRGKAPSNSIDPEFTITRLEELTDVLEQL